MDFGRPHIHEEGPTSRSNITLLPTPPPSTNKLDKLLTQSANKATTSLFQSTHNKQHHSNSNLYPERICPHSPLITPNSLVVILESFDNLTFTYATPGEIFHNRNGQFHHDDFLAKPFGSQIRSRNHNGVGFVYVLRPTAELWARSLRHRTQIVHELDASMVCLHLEIRPGMIVCESGTGSGAMSHALLRCVAPKGVLHTYEFNEMRVEHARDEFRKNQVSHLVRVHHRDVCGKKEDDSETKKKKKGDDDDDDDDNGGFGLGEAVADAVFLDLPEPWLAVPHAAFALKKNGRIGSYSPCMEQTQRTVEVMRRCGFHSIRTVEARLREYHVGEVELESPPGGKLVKIDRSDWRNNSCGGGGGSGGDSQSANEQDVTSMTCEEEEEDDDGGEEPKNKGNRNTPSKKRKITCARPFAVMRGHTAFLTFATAGLRRQPDPHEDKDSNEDEKEKGN